MAPLKALFALGAGERGGAERALLALVRHLPEHGVEPTVAAMAEGPFIEELTHAGVDVVQLDPVPRLRTAWAVPSAITQLAAAARASGAEVIVGSGEKMTLLAVRAARRAGVQSAGWLHDAPGHTTSAHGIQRLLRTVAPDVAIASSRWMTEEFEARLGRDVACVPYGLELDDLVDVVPSLDVRAGWDGRTVFAFVGRLQHWKGVDVFLRAAGELHRRRADVGFLVVGGSLFGREQEYAASLPLLADELGLGESVRFLGHRADAVGVMAAADVIVHASREPEPLGIVVLEGMALAKPVIASRARGPEELIDDGRTGALTPQDDAQALAAAMEHMVVAGPAGRTRIGEAARVAFDGAWTAQAMARRFAGALLAGRSSLDIGLVAQNVVRGDGQGRFALELGRELAERGHRVTVHAHACDPELEALARFRRVRRAPGPQIVDDLAFLARATPRVRLASHDVVAILGPTALPAGDYVLTAQYSHRGWRNSWTGSGAPGLRLRISTAVSVVLEQVVARRAARVVTLSPQISDDLAPGHNAETVVVTNGVDLDEFTVPKASERQEARASLGLAADGLVVGFVGEYLTARKGLDPLLAAIAAGPPEEHLLIAGRGPDLTARLATLGLQDRVTVLGYVDPRELYRASDVVAVPSWYEPFSIVAAEAAASGLPVVVTRAVGAASVLDDGGVIIEAPTQGELRSALDELWADPERRRERGAAARRAAEGLRWERARRPAADAVESLGWLNRARTTGRGR
ncbi:MAG: glycosyltransferase [Microthrixaceae bacterium]